MTTILIATDFSRASRNASLYGIELAKALNAKIILFNAYEVPQPAPALGVTISRYDVKTQIDKQLIEEADHLGPKREIIEIICEEGAAKDAIINIGNEKKADFIIAGMKGSGKNFKKIFGSTATSLAKETNIPVIIVPENTRFKNPDIIVFANDKTIDSEKIPEQLALITKFFKSKLYVVQVVANKNEEWLEVSDTTQQLRNVIQVPEPSFEYQVDTDIRHALSEFIKKRHADMLVMIPHKHQWLEKFFRKSETKDMIFHSKIPLLILPDIKH
jgi:nucleotide-binding universal stress UspA family protein